MHSQRRFSLILLWTITLGIALIVAYWSALNSGYLLWDDRLNIYENPYLLKGDWLTFWTAPYYLLYIPLTYTIWTWLYLLNPTAEAFHWLNLGLHFGSGLWLYLITREVWPKKRPLFAILISFLFCLHPMQVETVAWVSGGRDVLSLHFGLAAIYVALRSRNNWHSLFSIVLFSLGLLCKPTVAPLAFGVFVLLPKTRWNYQRLLATFAIQSAIGLYLLLENRASQTIAPDLAVAQLSLVDRVRVAFDSIGFYLIKFILPVQLSADYGRIPNLILAETTHWLYVAAAVGTLLACLWLRNDGLRRSLLFALLAILPISGLLPFQAQLNSTVSDRYIYLASIGLCWALLSFIPEKKLWWVIPVVVFWLVQTATRAPVFADNRRLFENMLKHTPNSFVALNSMGGVEFYAGDLQASESYFRQALAVRPEATSALANLSLLLWEQKRIPAIKEEFETRTRDLTWIRRNKGAASNLATIFTIVARAQKSEQRLVEANDSYCQAYELDSANASLVKEFEEFLALMRAARGQVLPCVPL
jgi:hypothetical protein